MKREVKFDPVVVTVLGVIIYCANDEIATDLLLNIKKQNLSIEGAKKSRQNYFFTADAATKEFLKVYDEINDR